MKFIRNSYKMGTNFVPISRECLGVNTEPYVQFAPNSCEMGTNFIRISRECLGVNTQGYVKFARNSYEMGTNFVRISRECLGVNTEAYVKFARNSYEFRTKFCELRPICSFYCCIAPSLLPLSPLVPCTFLPVCRSRSTRGRQTFDTTPGADSRPAPCASSQAREQGGPRQRAWTGPERGRQRAQ